MLLIGLLVIAVPSPPAAVVTFRGRPSGSILVYWEAPEYPNGPILGYKVTAAWTGQGMRPPALTVNYETHSTVDKVLTISGLQLGSEYQITVRARNVGELGVASGPKIVSISDDGKVLREL